LGDVEMTEQMEESEEIKEVLNPTAKSNA